MEILLSYENLLDGAMAWLKGLNVPPQHDDGGGVAQKYIGVSSLETWYGKGWWPPHMSMLLFVPCQPVKFFGVMVSSRTLILQPVLMRENHRQDPALRLVQNLARSYRRVWMNGSDSQNGDNRGD